MTENKFYTLPQLNYAYGDLAPYISEEQLMLHHQKHHQAYVNGANALLEKLDKARPEKVDLEMKAILKELSFHLGGHILHSIFWQILAPARLAEAPVARRQRLWRRRAKRAGQAGGGEPSEELAQTLINEFGSFERFKKEFSQAAVSIEGSGWAALALDWQTKRPLLMQIEKHNLNLFPAFRILLVLDVWEHAYYLDYKDERAKFVEAFWQIINWSAVKQRFLGGISKLR